MTESRYLECFSEATTEMMAIVGADQDYISNVGSYFTVETHIRHLDEVLIGEKFTPKPRSFMVKIKSFTYFIGSIMMTADY